jgi:PAS domain S-box-containing protein
MSTLPEQLRTAERARLFDAVERAAEQVGLAVFVVHVDAAPPVVIYASEPLARMVGRPAGELVGRPPWELLAAHEHDRIRDFIASRGPGAPPASHEVVVERPDGTRRTIEVGIARIATDGAELAVCYFRDATGEREAVGALRRSEQRFRRLIETAPDGVAITVRGQIVLMNPAAARMLGASSPEDVHGRMITDYLSAEDAARTRDRMAQVQTGVDLGSSEYGIVCNDRTVEVHATSCEWEGAPAILAFVRDVTERKRMQRELELSARLAAVGTMAAAVAHEINNPLTYVQLSLERLARDLEDLGHGAHAARLREHVDNALHGTARVTTIVRDLRAFAREADEPVGPVDVIEVVERSLKMVANDLRHRARVIRRFAEHVPVIEASASRLEQVLVNLLINASQSLPAGDPARDTITVEVAAGRGEVTIAVSDTGVGIGPAELAHVFEPFFTTKPSDEGTGLGLAVCKRIVERLQGRIAITSAPDAGTTVTVTVPAGAVALERQALTAEAGGARPMRILVVDDEPLVRKVIRISLAQHHHEVEEAGSGELALNLLAARPFDVIVCDLMMPGMSGRDLHQQVGARYPGLERRIVLVTGGAFVPRLAEFLASVDNPKLDKPFTEAEVLEAVATAAGR